jgi:hypothetical protein
MAANARIDFSLGSLFFVVTAMHVVFNVEHRVEQMLRLYHPGTDWLCDRILKG